MSFLPFSTKPNPPAPPYFKPVNIEDTIAQALQYDVQGFDWSDQDFAKRFPGLVATRSQQIDDAYNQLTGPTSPDVEADFTTRGLGQGLGETGGGDALGALGLTEGSFGRNVASASVANQLLDKQTYDRNYFDQLLANNPHRAFGIAGGDVASLAAANTGGINISNQQQYQSTLAGIYGNAARDQAQAQQIAAIAGILGKMYGSGGYNSGGGGDQGTFTAGGR